MSTDEAQLIKSQLVFTYSNFKMNKLQLLSTKIMQNRYPGYLLEFLIESADEVAKELVG